MVRDDNRGKKPRRLTNEEQSRMRKRIEERNKNIKKRKPNNIGLNDSRRRVDDFTEEEILQREIKRQREIYENELKNNNEDDKWKRNFADSEEFEEDDDYEEDREYSPSKISKKSKKSSKKRKKKNNYKRKFDIKKILKLIGVALIFLIVFSIFNTFNTLVKINNKDMIEAKPVPMNSTVNILLLGMDVGSVNNPNDSEAKRTDTIMVLNFNPTTKKVNLISIPRDTKIDIKGRTWKINAAYPVGGETEIVKQVEGLLGVDINYVAKINYEAFRDIIDAIGGVTVEIKHDMDYTDKSQDLRIQFKKGTTEHLDGKKAEEFFRWRKNDDGTGLAMGDLGRIENQHEFLQAVIKKCTSPLIIFRLPAVMKAIEKNVSTNMSGNTMLKYAFKLMTVGSKNFNMTTIKGTTKTIEGQSYFIFEKDKNKDLLNELQTGVVKSTSENKTPVSMGEIKVMILNSTNASGLAGRYKTTLDREGFKKVDIGTIENNPSKTTYAIVKSKEVEEIVKNELVGINEFKQMKDNYEYSNYELVIVLGLDSAN